MKLQGIVPAIVVLLAGSVTIPVEAAPRGEGSRFSGNVRPQRMSQAGPARSTSWRQPTTRYRSAPRNQFVRAERRAPVRYSGRDTWARQQPIRYSGRNAWTQRQPVRYRSGSWDNRRIAPVAWRASDNRWDNRWANERWRGDRRHWHHHPTRWAYRSYPRQAYYRTPIAAFFGGSYASPYYSYTNTYGSPYYYDNYYDSTPYVTYSTAPAYTSRTVLAPVAGSTVASVQIVLRDLGFYNGEIDGILGPQTRRAIALYKRNQGLPVDGQIDRYLLRSLRLV